MAGISRRVVRFCAVLTIGGMGIFGCGKSDTQGSAASGNSSSTEGSKSTSGARPGYATGHLLHQSGKPIDVQGAKLTVSIYGISGKSGEKVYYNPKISADGSYEQKLVDGTYAFSGAQITVPFNGKHFTFNLEPIGDDRSDRDSEKGIVQDYVWKLTGLRPGQDADESNFTKWNGGSVNMQFQFYREDIKKSVPKPPAGTKCVFTLTPVGKLIDGSEGKVLTFTREYDPLLTGLKNGNLPDVPIGNYTVTGEEIAVDGTKKPLRIQQALAKYEDSGKVEFAPGTGSGAWPANIGFTRDE